MKVFSCKQFIQADFLDFPFFTGLLLFSGGAYGLNRKELLQIPQLLIN
jgi:hypothetical protein